jgi:hypothetical protein
VNRRDSSGRNSRYFIASTLIVVGLACAATLTNSLGNDLATVLIALGLIMFVAFLFKDLGLNIDGRSAPRVPDLPPLPDEPAHEQVAPLTTAQGAHEQPAPVDAAAAARRLQRERRDEPEPAPVQDPVPAPAPAADAPRTAAESARRLAGRD